MNLLIVNKENKLSKEYIPKNLTLVKTVIPGSVYKYEPWHLRYVGKEIAKEIYESDITLEEYKVKILVK